MNPVSIIQCVYVLCCYAEIRWVWKVANSFCSHRYPCSISEQWPQIHAETNRASLPGMSKHRCWKPCVHVQDGAVLASRSISFGKFALLCKTFIASLTMNRTIRACWRLESCCNAYYNIFCILQYFAFAICNHGVHQRLFKINGAGNIIAYLALMPPFCF